MSAFRVAWPIYVAVAVALSGCVLDTTESDNGDHEWIGEAPLELDAVSGGGDDDGTEDQRQETHDDGSTQSEENAVAVPHAEPDPEPWDPGDGTGSDDA